MNGRAIWHAMSGVGLLVILGGVALLVQWCASGCAPAPRVLNAVEIAEWTLPYSAELDLCRAEAKKLPRVQRFNAYVGCEEVATEKTCKRLSTSARVQWRQCDGVTP